MTNFYSIHLFFIKKKGSDKIIQTHKQKLNKELQQCNDPALAVVLKAIYEENIYQQNVNDIIKVCIKDYNQFYLFY